MRTGLGSAAGTLFDGQWWYLDVHHPEEAVKIDLDHEHYTALISRRAGCCR